MLDDNGNETDSFKQYVKPVIQIACPIKSVFLGFSFKRGKKGIVEGGVIPDVVVFDAYMKMNTCVKSM